MEYTTKGTCSRKILLEVEDGKVHNVQFVGGCNGNTQGRKRSHLPHERHRLQRTRNIMSRPACKSTGTGYPEITFLRLLFFIIITPRGMLTPGSL